MNRKAAVIWSGVLLCALAVPFAGTVLGIRAGNIGNEQQNSAFPAAMKDGVPNWRILSDIGNWYNSSHAFRSQLIDMDARSLLAAGDSANDQVVVGKDGWDYYTDELDDLYGTSRMSSRAVFDLCRSMKMAQDELEKNGTSFIFTVAPNKSTMVPEYLPEYVSLAAGAGGRSGNLDAVASEAQSQGLHFLDLRGVLTKAASDNGYAQEEMWLKTDSHWNGLGAKACADAILESLDRLNSGDGQFSASETSGTQNRVEDFSGWTQTAEINGDLESMLLPVTAKEEADWEAPEEERPVFHVEEEIESYFDPRITAFGSGNGTLTVWRDSFCNSMLPYLAGATEKSYFTRAVPYYLSQALSMAADRAVVECAERMLPQRASYPAVFEAPEVSPSAKARELFTGTIGKDGDWNGQLYVTTEDPWITINGWIDGNLCEKDQRGKEAGIEAGIEAGKIGNSDRILIQISDETFEACPAVVTKDDGSTTDWGFQARISAEFFEGEMWPEGTQVTVLAEPESWEESGSSVQTPNETFSDADRSNSSLAPEGGPKG